MLLRALLGLCVLLLGLAFHSRNHQLIMLDFYVNSVEIPLSWALVGALVIGALSGALVLLPRLLRLQYIARRERRRAALTTASIPAPTTSQSEATS